MLKAYGGRLQGWAMPSAWADPTVVEYAARVSVWGRWLIWLVALFQFAYRPLFWFPDNIEPDHTEYLLPLVALVTFNGLVHYRLMTAGPSHGTGCSS